MLPRIVTSMLFVLLFTAVSCGDRSQPTQANLSSEDLDLRDGDSGDVTAALDLARRNLITMTFTKWGDVIAVDGGLASAEAKDGRCRFSKPLKSDASTQWNPFQIYWVIFDSHDDVRNGKELTGVFAENESHTSGSLVRKDGARPLGFSYLTERAASFVNLSPVNMHDDDARLETILNVAGHKAAIRAHAELVEGSCRTRVEACRGGEECYAGGSFAPLGNIHVVQNLVGMPKSVEQEPENRITKQQK